MEIENDYDRNVFINCAFDPTFINQFRAIVFTVHICGFIARCASETGNSVVRIEKIFKIIEECKFGIHDLSRIEITDDSPLPRFNMPYELGVFMGCKEFGEGAHKTKDFLVLDSEPYRYKILVSDLAGYDFPSYEKDDINSLIKIVRDWLNQSSSKTIPGSDFHQDRYSNFLLGLPAMCTKMHTKPKDLNFKEFYALTTLWIRQKNIDLLHGIL